MLKAIAAGEVPAFDLVATRLRQLYPQLSVLETARDFNTDVYCFRLIGPTNRPADLILSREQLNDLRDNPEQSNSEYTIEIIGRLDSQIRERVETAGLLSFTEDVLRFLLLRFIDFRSTSRAVTNKWNAIGRGAKGQFEEWLRTELTS